MRWDKMLSDMIWYKIVWVTTWDAMHVWLVGWCEDFNFNLRLTFRFCNIQSNTVSRYEILHKLHCIAMHETALHSDAWNRIVLQYINVLPPSVELSTDMVTSMRPLGGVNFTAFDRRFPNTSPSLTGSISTKMSAESSGGNIVMLICLDKAGKNWSFAFVFRNSTSGVRLFVNIIIPASIFSKVSRSLTT